MQINVIELKKLINERFNGNYKKLAKALNLDTITVYRLLTGRTRGGIKFFSQLIDFCKTNNLDMNRYIFFNVPFHKRNANE